MRMYCFAGNFNCSAWPSCKIVTAISSLKSFNLKVKMSQKESLINDKFVFCFQMSRAILILC